MCKRITETLKKKKADKKQKKAEKKIAKAEAKRKKKEAKRAIFAKIVEEWKKKDHYQKAAIAIILAVGLIVVIDFSCVGLIVCMELAHPASGNCNATDIAQERTLLSTGLALIGIAISVWATLNILNAFDKNDILELKASIQKLKDDQLSLSEAKKRYDTEISQINEQNKNQFLYYLEQNSHDDSIAFVMDKFKDRKDLPYSQLAIVMQYYFNVIQLHKQNTDKEKLETTATEGMKYTKKLLTETAFPKDVQQFLHYCLAELYFYRAYCDCEKKRYWDSLAAIQEYEMAQELFDVLIPEYNPSVNFKQPDSIRSRFPNTLLPYWCNTIGECYSKAAQGYMKTPSIDITEADIDHIRNKAVFYCRFAVILSSSKNQVYLRNLGCALEAANGDKTFDDKTAKDIAKQYQDAMDISIKDNNIPWKVFYTWLSFYHKCINQQIKDLQGEQEPAEWLASVEDMADHPIYNNFETALTYANLACQTYPNDLRFLKFRAFVLRDRCIWEVKRKGKTDLAKQYYDAFNEVFQALNVLFRKDPDPFTKELIEWNKALKAVLVQKPNPTHKKTNLKHQKP